MAVVEEREGLGTFNAFPFVEQAAAFLVQYSSGDEQERWEEECGVFALDTGGGDRGADLLRGGRLRERTDRWSWAGFLETSIPGWTGSASRLKWTTTTRGVPHPDVKVSFYSADSSAGFKEPYYNPTRSVRDDSTVEPRARREDRALQARRPSRLSGTQIGEGAVQGSAGGRPPHC